MLILKSGRNRLQVWLQIINNPELIHLPMESIYANKRVCGRHFTEDLHVPNKRNLKYNAIPSLYVQGTDIANKWRYKSFDDLQPSKVGLCIPINVNSATESRTSSDANSLQNKESNEATKWSVANRITFDR